MSRPEDIAADLTRDLLEIGMETAMLAVEAGVVIAYRSGAFCGFRPYVGTETHRMFAEKPPAFFAAALAAGLTALGGQRPDRVMAAALHPIRSETNRNLRRLGGVDPDS
ncbi:hypothetical protein [Tropicimonas sp. IMCC6043]|uniref:hypothetical protein n=1 Tax=Tropicimonas sp. IMCC6043 TaxID=2510645 RepID=UPI00101C0DA4|nr:hypothetical protein [Tropicimonas sp. IMCC6043]RYH10622.1 hypothetical protein EU800_07735 [Tropicimonas sp. IMCC6043]